MEIKTLRNTVENISLVLIKSKSLIKYTLLHPDGSFKNLSEWERDTLNTLKSDTNKLKSIQKSLKQSLKFRDEHNNWNKSSLSSKNDNVRLNNLKKSAGKIMFCLERFYFL